MFSDFVAIKSFILYNASIDKLFIYLQIRIWDYFNKKKHALLTDFNQTLEEAQIQMDQDVSIILDAHNLRFMTFW